VKAPVIHKGHQMRGIEGKNRKHGSDIFENLAVLPVRLRNYSTGNGLISAIPDIANVSAERKRV